MTRTTTRTRFSQYFVVRAREPASFWRENMIDVVFLLRVLGECRNGGIKLSTVSSFIILLYSGESLTSFHKNKRADFSGERVHWSFPGCLYFENTRIVVALVLEYTGLYSLQGRHHGYCNVHSQPVNRLTLVKSRTTRKIESTSVLHVTSPGAYSLACVVDMI